MGELLFQSLETDEGDDNAIASNQIELGASDQGVSRIDLLDYYTRFYRNDLIDLSSSSPSVPWLPAGDIGAQGGKTNFVPPTGAPALRERLAARYRSVEPDGIVLTCGASEALVAVANTLIGPSDIVHLTRGVYPSFVEAARRNGAQLEWGASAEGHGRVLACCNPTVPDGRLEFWAVSTDPDCFVVADEAHLEFVHAHRDVMRAADASPNHLSVGSFSKSVGHGGLRLGWVAATDRALCAQVNRHVQLLSGGPPAPSIGSALNLVDEFARSQDSIHAAIAMHAERVYRALDASGWTYRRADGGLTVEAWPPRRVDPESEGQVLTAGYFLVPCRVYGSDPGSYRISILAPVRHLLAALRMLCPARERQATVVTGSINPKTQQAD